MPGGLQGGIEVFEYIFMKYFMHLPERPFLAIKNCTKKVEGRVSKTKNDRYSKIKAGDTIAFEQEPSGELLEVTVNFVHHYQDVRSMLETEGVKNVLSSGGNVEQGIESYNSIPGYKENLPKNGIYAIGITPLPKK